MLRRLRIKALAAVPVRKKLTQNSADSTETNNDIDKEKKEENISNINDTEQETTKDVTQVKEQKEKDVIKTDTFKQKEQKEKDTSSTDISTEEKLKEKDIPNIDVPGQKAVIDITKDEEEIKKKQDKINLKESVIDKEKLDSQELCSPLKSYSQELHAQAKSNSQKLHVQAKSNSQELHSPVKSNFQKLHTQAKSNFQELHTQTKSNSQVLPAQAKPNCQKSPSPLKSDSQELHSPVKSNFQEVHTEAKSNSQELHTHTKSNSQEFHAQAKSNSQEPLATGFKFDKIQTDQSIQKNTLPSDVSIIIDIASPTKVIQNRPCFMRPTPRLDSGGRIRKNSIQGSGASASESEDEHSKRVASVIPNRVRNDSVCSVQSNKETNVSDNQNNSQKIKTTQKRRTLVSESARKLAEARREFLLKHENKTPDRSQLKMYDLIYYNPVTNPMKKLSSEHRAKSITTSQSQPMGISEEEDEDDPATTSAPQVKVGPDGQLIIDEQSLVIEQADARREEKLLASDITIEDDNFRGGFYKRHKRSKEWPKWETFKFYRVLNVVGTDFLLMQTLFPNRSRQEIKQKYKKEERVNRQLVEKALKYHQEFDTDMLQEQLEILQNLENIQNTSKKAQEKTKSGQSLSRSQRKRKHRLVAKSIEECGSLSNDLEAEDTVVFTTNDEIDTEICSDTNNVQQQMGKKKTRRSKKRSDDKSEKFDDYSTYTDADSDSSEEIYQLRPTRSGRLSKKIRKLQAPDLTTRNSDIETKLSVDNKIPSHVAVEVTEYVNTQVTNSENIETTSSDNIMSMIPNINQMEPGALVIVSKESAENPGNTILQVYMVASNIDSNTTVTSSVASGNQSLEPLTNQPENTEPVDIVDDSKK
ncbi:PREDICTED: transcription factor TFIIIB component B'' homolog [Cyphomyrmex costatus]|uniref:Transcription factor TFIIIB component B'' like protein n=1 Tax=Cyphomyrmex costatus TaxID=456900 RepID=A0A151ILH8_9HYME|nr:PREDICTED: transcription factor TFIIIB component B'' homolog [Cyphomyrmex costatus]KYN05589.1 Transcription factor TFIIIB component B'' like protein [Cyphomyrmex costatus]